MSQWPMSASITTSSKQSVPIPRSDSQETLDADDFTSSELPPPSPVFDLDDFMIDPTGNSDYMNPTVSPKQLGNPWAQWDTTTAANMYPPSSENLFISSSTPSSYSQSTSIMIPPGASTLSSMGPLSPQHDSTMLYKFPEPAISSPQSVLSSFYAQQQSQPRQPLHSPYHRTQPALYQPSSSIYSDYELAVAGTGIDVEPVPEMYQMGKLDGQQYHGIAKLSQGDSLYAVNQSIYAHDLTLQSAPHDVRTMRYHIGPRRDSSVPPYSLDSRHLRHKAVFPSSAPTPTTASDFAPFSPSGSPRSARGASLARSSPPLVPESPKYLSPTSPTTQFTASPAQLSASPHLFAGTSPIFAHASTPPVTFVDQTAQYSTSPVSDEAGFVSSAHLSSSFANDSRLRKRRRPDGSDAEDDSDEKRSDDTPTKSELRPPKQAPSMWQIYFADWLQDHKLRHPHDKLNVAQAAKEAGQLYKTLSEMEKESLKRRVQLEKEIRERRVAAWHRTLTPEDIKRENKYRAAQRKAGLSRRANIKDPNAPKKPLSAYFMFLAKIRSDQRLVDQVFGGETETTRQSVLAARRWREMSDEEKKPFLTQAEHDKIQYEAMRKVYEETASGPVRGPSSSRQMMGTGYIVPQHISFSEDITTSILNARPSFMDTDEFKVVSYDPDATITARKSATRSAPIPIFPSSTGTIRRRVARKSTRHSHSGDGGIPRSLSGDSPVESSESDDDWVPGKSI